MNTTTYVSLTEEQDYRLYLIYAYAIFGWVYTSVLVAVRCIVRDDTKDQLMTIQYKLIDLENKIVYPKIVPYIT